MVSPWLSLLLHYICALLSYHYAVQHHAKAMNVSAIESSELSEYNSKAQSRAQSMVRTEKTSIMTTNGIRFVFPWLLSEVSAPAQPTHLVETR